MLGVFALNVYIGLYDKFLSKYQPLHWELNWVIAAVDLVAAIVLIGLPKNIVLVSLGGIVWPIVYVISLGADVYTRLCAGGSQANCWPSKTDAFQYLIVNNPNVPGGYGWQLWTGTMPTILALLLITFVISIATVVSLRRIKPAKLVPPPAGPPSGSTG